jgi:hypothetical protein
LECPASPSSLFRVETAISMSHQGVEILLTSTAGNSTVSFNAASIHPARDDGQTASRSYSARAGRIDANTFGRNRKVLPMSPLKRFAEFFGYGGSHEITAPRQTVTPKQSADLVDFEGEIRSRLSGCFSPVGIVENLDTLSLCA